MEKSKKNGLLIFMKRNMNTIVFILMCMMYPQLLSAQNTCESADKWAKENIDYYLEAPRSEFVKLKFEQQRSLYNLFSPEQKADLWKCKWKDIRKSDLLSSAEKKELKKFYSLVSPRVFDEADAGTNAMFQAESEMVMAIMSEKFGWDDQKVFTYLVCWMTEAEIRAYCTQYNLSESDFL